MLKNYFQIAWAQPGKKQTIYFSVFPLNHKHFFSATTESPGYHLTN